MEWSKGGLMPRSIRRRRTPMSSRGLLQQDHEKSRCVSPHNPTRPYVTKPHIWFKPCLDMASMSHGFVQAQTTLKNGCRWCLHPLCSTAFALLFSPQSFQLCIIACCCLCQPRESQEDGDLSTRYPEGPVGGPVVCCRCLPSLTRRVQPG